MNPIKILIVDDEVDFLDTITERLKLRGFDASKAPDGYIAIDLVEKEDFDVVILDLKMPGIDGQEVLNRIKEKNKKAEVIIFTAHGSEEVAEETMKAGAFCFITKPVDIDKLISVINLALDSQKENREFEII